MVKVGEDCLVDESGMGSEEAVELLGDEQALVSDMSRDRKLAEIYVLRYELLKRNYEASKKSVLERGPKTMGAETKGNLPGRPVETAVVKKLGYDEEHPEYSWLRAVDIALRSFGERRRIFISVRREAEVKAGGGRGRHGWVVYVQRRYSEKIQARFLSEVGWYGERTLKAWWQQILDRVVEIHLRIT